MTYSNKPHSKPLTQSALNNSQAYSFAHTHTKPENQTHYFLAPRPHIFHLPINSNQSSLNSILDLPLDAYYELHLQSKLYFALCIFGRLN